MFNTFSRLVCDERIEGDPNVRKRFAPFKGNACDFVLRRGSRYTLAEAKGEQDVGTARLQIESTIARIVQCDRSAVFGHLAVFIRRGPVYADLPLNSTDGLARYIEFEDLAESPQFRLSSAHLARRTDKNYHILLEPSGSPCLPVPQGSTSDRWGINRVVPPEIRLYVTRFKRPLPR